MSNSQSNARRAAERRGARLRYGALILTLATSLAACSHEQPGTFIASAKAFMAKDDFGASIIQLKNALQQDPKNAEARYLLGLSELRSGHPGAAQIELSKAEDLGLRSDQLQVALARADLARGEADKVLSRFGTKALTSSTQQAELRAVVGMAELTKNHLHKASSAFAQALALDSTNATANIGMARIAASKGDFARAMKRVGVALRAEPSNVDALAMKGELLEAQGHDAAAEQAYRKAISASGRRLAPRLDLLALLIKEHAFDKASAELAAVEKIAPKDPRTQYARALLLLAQRKFAPAKEAILPVLRVAPDYAPALVLAGSAALETGAYAEAESDLRSAAYNAPNALAPKRLLAMTYLRMGKTELALTQVKALLEKKAHDPRVLALAGEVYLAHGDIAQAARYYSEAKSLAPKNAILQTRLAEIRFVKGDRARAIEELESASASHPHEYGSDLALITALLHQRQVDKALTALQQLAKKQPNNPLTYNLRGLAFVLKRDFPSARSNFEHALRLQPTYMPAVINLASLDLRERKIDAAKARYEAVLKKAPNDEQAMLRLAVLMRISGANVQQIEALLKRGVVGNPNSPAARLALVNFYLSRRDSAEALAAAQRAAAVLPHAPPIVDALGVAQLAAGDPHAAIATFSHLADLLPNAPTPLVRQAQAYMAAKEPDDAIHALRAALALRPDLPVVERDLAAAYVATDRGAEAVREARALQAKRPDQPFGYALEGEIYVAQKDWTRAIRVYRHAVSKFQSPLLVVRAHAVMEAAGKASEAHALAAKWIKDHPADAIVLGYLAQRDLGEKHYAAAVKRYRSALKRRPHEPVFLNNMAWAMHQLKEPDALEYARQAHQLAPNDPAIMDTLGWILVESGHSGRGLELLGRASEAAPNAYDIRLHFAKALIHAGRKKAAHKELEVLVKLDHRLPVQHEAATLLSGL